MNTNTKWLILWADRMIKKYGNPPGEDWCRKLAYFMGEAGNDSPSNKAVIVAKSWELSGGEVEE